MAAPPKPPFKPTATVIANGYTDQEGRDLAEKGGNATVQQLVLALDVIVGLFEDQGVTCAVMGGLALNFRGSTRDTHDVDITAACDMRTLRQACLSHPRLKVPIGPGSGVMRVFVHVGPKYGESVAEKWVQVDIILRGSLGAPDDLHGTTETVSTKTQQGPKEYVVIDLLRHFQSKLGAFFARNGKSDFEDLVFMCNTYFEQIAVFRGQLSFAQREHFVRQFIAQTGIRGRARAVKLKRLLAVP
ncbi:hypothetical protein QBC37DRAFT_405166 [Rhypophila decipiens]|uniref:Uncharacterized protein n=1 Tax=Rhypophila decipiens TaxID=261697 RepID=A0AAN6XX61_9PEZI|nr:hypothetical protein QBC37DRAFT_405166 [Rhypophila decipiens]